MQIVISYEVPKNYHSMADCMYINGREGELLDLAMNCCSEWSIDLI